MNKKNKDRLFNLLLENTDKFHNCQYCKRYNGFTDNPYCMRYCRIYSKWKPCDSLVADIDLLIDKIVKIVKED